MYGQIKIPPEKNPPESLHGEDQGDPPRGLGVGVNIHVFSGGLSENECKYLNERDHKIYCSFFVFG